MGRLGRLHAVPNRFHLHESQAPLPELWKCIRSAMLKQVLALASLGHIAASQSR